MRARILVIAALGAAGLPAQSWTKANPSAAAPGRAFHAMAYDLVRGRVIVFGDETNALSSTWEWTGTNWVQAQTTRNPNPSRGMTMAYDFARKRTVLFGGRVGNPSQQLLNETWEFDGNNWTRMQPRTSPPARYRAAMAYDFGRKRVVLFGGQAAGRLQDTWEYDGTDWKLIPINSPPPARVAARMVYDTARGVMVLFGGRSNTDLDDTWEYDGKAWKERDLPVRPPHRWMAAMAYDTKRRVTVLYGGRSNNVHRKLFSDTWEYDGTTWRLVRVPGLGPRWAVVMAFDAMRNETVLFGGQNRPGGTELADTWRYRGGPRIPALYTPFGKGCGGSAGVPQLAAAPNSLPFINSSFTLRATRLPAGRPASLVWGASNTLWAGLSLPFDLTVLSMPGCTLYASMDITQGLQHNGAANVTIKLPDNPTMIRQHIYHQVVTLDPTANTPGIGVSNGADMRIGER